MSMAGNCLQMQPCYGAVVLAELVCHTRFPSTSLAGVSSLALLCMCICMRRWRSQLLHRRRAGRLR
jgi:hypothetical protein